MNNTSSIDSIEARASRFLSENNEKIDLMIKNITLQGKGNKVNDSFCLKKLSLFDNSERILYIIGKAFIALLILVTSYVLVESTTDVIGKDFIGYMKAISLEIGILVVVSKSTTKVVERICKFFLIAIFFVFSGVVLHTGSTSNLSKDISEKVMSDPLVSLVLDSAEKRKDNINAMGDKFISKKSDSLDKLDDNTKIVMERIRTLESSGLVGIRLASYSDYLSRITLLGFNVFFCHFCFLKRRV